MSEPRFVVREWSNCYMQVIDTAEAHRIAFELPPGHGRIEPIERRRRAHAEARRLNDWDAHTDAPLDVPRLRGQGWDD